ncbi:MAG: hypothetical protein ACI30L_07340 [Muribaculaceae bacterium]
MESKTVDNVWGVSHTPCTRLPCLSMPRHGWASEGRDPGGRMPTGFSRG